MQYNELMHKARNTMKHASINETRNIIKLIDNVEQTRVNLALARKNYELSITRLVDAVMVLGGVKWYNIMNMKDCVSVVVDSAIEVKNYGNGVKFYEQSYNHHKSVLLNNLLLHDNATKALHNNNNKQQHGVK